MAMQMTLLGWLYIADILDNPYGFNVDYDKNLEEVGLNIHTNKQTSGTNTNTIYIARKVEKIFEGARVEHLALLRDCSAASRGLSR